MWCKVQGVWRMTCEGSENQETLDSGLHRNDGNGWALCRNGEAGQA